MSRILLLRACAPTALGPACDLVRRAARFPLAAAQANAATGDPRPRLRWDAARTRFASQPLTPRRAEGRRLNALEAGWTVALALLPLTLLLFQPGAPARRYILEAAPPAAARAWLDSALEASDLAPTTDAAVFSHDAPPGGPLEPAAFRAPADRDTLASLGAWYDLAHQVLCAAATEGPNTGLAFGPLRCVEGDIALTASVSGLEVGFSPGEYRGVGARHAPHFFVRSGGDDPPILLLSADEVMARGGRDAGLGALILDRLSTRRA